MTDRERLLERIGECEKRSSRTWCFLIHEGELPSSVTDDPRAREEGTDAAHHALAALALTAQDSVCQQIIDIMDEHDRQLKERGYVDTPGGLEHMGDVWSLLGVWREQLQAGKECR